MAHEMALDYVQAVTKVSLEDFIKVMRLYGGKEQQVSMAFRNAIHEVVKDVRPTVADLKAIAALRQRNLAARYQKRVTDARYRGETYVDILDENGCSGKRGRRDTIPGRKPKPKR